METQKYCSVRVSGPKNQNGGFPQNLPGRFTSVCSVLLKVLSSILHLLGDFIIPVREKSRSTGALVANEVLSFLNRDANNADSLNAPYLSGGPWNI